MDQEVYGGIFGWFPSQGTSVVIEQKLGEGQGEVDKNQTIELVAVSKQKCDMSPKVNDRKAIEISTV